MWLAFVLLPCNHLVPEETHKLILNHATTRQQTDRAVGLWQHIYHPPVIADTNCTVFSALYHTEWPGQHLEKRIWFLPAVGVYGHPACGPSCAYALCVPPKSLRVPACANGSLCLTYGNKTLRAGGNHSKAQILNWIFTNSRNTRGEDFKLEPFMLVHEMKITNVQPMLILMVLAQLRAGDWQWSSALFWLHHPGQQQQRISQPLLTERILSQIFLPQKLYSSLSSVFLSRLTDTGMKSF